MKLTDVEKDKLLSMIPDNESWELLEKVLSDTKNNYLASIRGYNLIKGEKGLAYEKARYEGSERTISNAKKFLKDLRNKY